LDLVIGGRLSLILSIVLKVDSVQRVFMDSDMTDIG
jgi:hypothetical protein